MNATDAVRRSLALGVSTVVAMAILGIAVWTWQGGWRGHGSDDDRPLEGLKVFGTLPDFSLVERSGRRVTLAEFRGKVWIANFIYTHCTDTCPLQSARLARMQAEFSDEQDLRLVSITVDPEQDVPQVLAEYAAGFGADRDRWLFLTGEKKALYALAQEGFRLSAVDPADAIPPPQDRNVPARRPAGRQGQSSRHPAAPGSEVVRILDDAVIWLFDPGPVQAHPGHPLKPFIHSARFVLVDRQSRIRGYYPSDDEEALDRLRRDLRALLREGRP